jgi:hypothetical protein
MTTLHRKIEQRQKSTTVMRQVGPDLMRRSRRAEGVPELEPFGNGGGPRPGRRGPSLSSVLRAAAAFERPAVGEATQRVTAG